MSYRYISPANIDLEAFGLWLIEHEGDVFDCTDSHFQCPLARWLTDLGGALYGVDGYTYGAASWDAQHWRELPPWARGFHSRVATRTLFSSHIYGRQAFLMLAEVEVGLPTHVYF